MQNLHTQKIPKTFRIKITTLLQSCISPTIRIGQEIHCVPYAAFYFYAATFFSPGLMKSQGGSVFKQLVSSF